MTISEFVSDRLGKIILQIFCTAVAAAFLLATGTSSGVIIILLLFFLLIFILTQISDYLKCNRRLSGLHTLMEGLDQKYLFTECVPPSHSIYEQKLFELLRISGRSMIGAVSDARAANREYQDYIESWVHEIKTPITAARLLCQHRSYDVRNALVSLDTQSGSGKQEPLNDKVCMTSSDSRTISSHNGTSPDRITTEHKSARVTAVSDTNNSDVPLNASTAFCLPDENITMKVRDFHSMDGHAACQSGRLSMMGVYCENSGNSKIAETLETSDRKLSAELAQIETHVERVLYYARAESPEKDCIIRQVSLSKTVSQAIRNHKTLLIQNKIQVETENLDFTVYTDAKWAAFILGQLLQNAIRYRRTSPQDLSAPLIKLSARSSGRQVQLAVSDNGIGIPAHELPRIFDRGFTGSNGRLRGGSTGMGLYLCRKLADSLEIGLCITSEEQRGTVVTLTFPSKHT